MGQDLYVLVLLTVETKVGGRKTFVNFAVPCPENHVDVCLSGDVTTQKLVGQEYHPAAIQRLDHLYSIGRSAANVGFRFHRCRGVHIAHHGNARIAAAQDADIVCSN